jgi:methyl-accepting chemotaxis protein
LIPGANGGLALRSVIPFIGMKEFRGSRCLGCHAVNEGAVLGGVSVIFDISQDQANMRHINQLLWLGQLALQVALFFVIRGIVRRQLRVLGAEPQQAVGLAQRVAGGDLTTDVELAAGDSSSMMAQLDQMQHSLSNLVSRVRTGAEGVSVASTEISQGNSDLSARTEQEASAIQETASAMQELGAMVGQNVESAQQASTLASGAAEIAVKGGHMVGQVVSTMRDINASSHQISDIISVIDSIAFQTNILALNAAVEAARAGEQGRGFAVVAAEVRLLAGRSAQAAKEISALINASVDKVEQGTQVVNQAGATMQEIVQSIQRVAGIVAEITAASHAQAKGVQEVGRSIERMDEFTQHNAALVEEMAAAANGLDGLAKELVHTVSVFKVYEGQ